MIPSPLFTLVVIYLLPSLYVAKTVNSRCGAILTVPDTYNYTRSELRRVNITDANAVCNDGSPGVYYIRKTGKNSTWIIYLEGGVGCYTTEECKKRYKEWPELMSSRHYPPAIEGQDIFDPDPLINPDYWDYNMVFIPYCTSDLWLGTGKRDNGNYSFCGATIFESVTKELLRRGMNKANEVVLVGSGTGGIGVLNQAGWLQFSLPKDTTFSVILDSAWFINYNDNLIGNDNFNLLLLPWTMDISRHAPCTDEETVGYFCCISAPCMVTKAAQREGGLPRLGWFPNISYFVIFSQYDIFMLSKSLQKLDNEVKDVKKRQTESFRTMTEYGGEMKMTLKETSRKARNMSYFVPSCLQHVYLTPSNLRAREKSIHGFQLSSDSKQFRSSTDPEVWSRTYSTKDKNSTKVTLQCAIHEWNQKVRKKKPGSDYPVCYSDDCQGAGCNPHCPEKVLLGGMNDLWPAGASAVVVCLVLTVTCICLVYKAVMMWRRYALFKAYRAFINEGKVSAETSNMALRLSEAVGVACLDLRYSVHLSQDAIRQVSEIEKGRLAEEDEAQLLLSSYSYRPPQASVQKSGKHSKKQGADKNSLMEETDLGTLRSRANEQLVSDNDGRGTWESANGRQNIHSQNDSEHGTLDDGSDKFIINGISSYFNPKEMVAIMGPSGCGKTTFMDLLTGRRRTGKQEGEIFVNGIRFDYLRDWYKKHSGYVLQSAVPYYEEMTVRENLLLAAFLRLPRSLSAEQRFNRVENIIDQVGLNIVEDTVVGGCTGSGLSGGQKRRLAVAIQLLSLPRVVFLDEPTSGLDATSSMELLQHLQCIACSGRLVVLTIHQPRLEIFHMFDRILLLCQGEVAYYGSPMDAPTLFLKAYQVAKLEGDAPDLDHNKNPADVIMDMLSSESGRRAILNYYKMTFERKNVKTAIRQAKRSYSDDELHEDNKEVDSGWMNRFLVLETRACLRTTISQKFYLPAIFFLLSLVTGLAYLQAKDMLLIMAAFSIYSFSSSIFMFPPVYNHLDRALKLYQLEREDGIGRSVELLFQTFMRYVAISTIPLVVCSVILCLMVLPSSSWSIERFFDVALFSLALNQTWTSIAIMLVCVFPLYGHKISPLVSCSAGFAGGFFIPPSRMKPYFLWLMYLNPSYYGYAGMLRLVLPGLQTGCDYQSTIECYPDTGAFWIDDFGIDEVQPYLYLLILVIMTVVTFLIAWMALEIRYSDLTFATLKGFFFGSKSKDCVTEYSSQSTHSQVGEHASDSDGDNDVQSERDSLKDFQVGSPYMDVDISDDDSSGKAVFSPVSKDRETVVTFKVAATPNLSPSSNYRRQYSRRTSTRSYFLPDRKHSVFCPEELSRDASSLESRRNTIDDVRVSVARDTNLRRNHMKSSMKTFTQMQLTLIKDDENLEAMNHDVPLKKIQRRLSKRSAAIGRRRVMTLPSFGTEQAAIPEDDEESL